MRTVLMAAVPCKRFDYEPMCKDGRGGWVFSQFGADRYAADPTSFAIKLGLAVFTMPPIQDDEYVEWTELTARMEDEVVGEDQMHWRCPNEAARRHADVSTVEWIQAISCPINRNGLIEVSAAVKLSSQSEAIPVEGAAYVHVTIEDTNYGLLDPETYV